VTTSSASPQPSAAPTSGKIRIVRIKPTGSTPVLARTAAELKDEEYKKRNIFAIQSVVREMEKTGIPTEGEYERLTDMLEERDRQIVQEKIEEDVQLTSDLKQYELLKSTLFRFIGRNGSKSDKGSAQTSRGLMAIMKSSEFHEYMDALTDLMADEINRLYVLAKQYGWNTQQLARQISLYLYGQPAGELKAMQDTLARSFPSISLASIGRFMIPYIVEEIEAEEYFVTRNMIETVKRYALDQIVKHDVDPIEQFEAPQKVPPVEKRKKARTKSGRTRIIRPKKERPILGQE